MINYSELADFERFEDLCEKLLDKEGIRTRRLGRGPGQLGKDIVGIEKISGCLSNFKPRKWLIECKFTKSNEGAIDETDVMNIVDRLIAQEASGYMLFTNARLRVNLERTLNGLKQRQEFQIQIWTEKIISKKILDYSEVFREFFPISFKKWILDNKIIYLNQVKRFKEPLVCIKNDVNFIFKAPKGKLTAKKEKLKFEEINNMLTNLIKGIDEDLNMIQTLSDN